MLPTHGRHMGIGARGIPRWFASTKSDPRRSLRKALFLVRVWASPLDLGWGGRERHYHARVRSSVRGGSRVIAHLDLAFGVRDTGSFGKSSLTPAASFHRDDVLGGEGPKARYWAWEAELVAIAPLPHSALVVDFVGVRTLDVPVGSYVYDESYRAVVAKPLFGVLRVAAVARLLREDALKVGVLSEVVFSTGRERKWCASGLRAA